uniref:Pyrin domain-containing protein n=1 Tax=Sinocyclocheilus rhinocerous TaxID=307959 RepID=A0A673KBI1_9TELE
MASDKVLLLNSLKDLRENELKEFQWHLKNDHESISESEMEKADRLKTVDKMVECFGPEEALRITVKILKKINQNNLAVELENKHKQGNRNMTKAQLDYFSKAETCLQCDGLQNKSFVVLYFHSDLFLSHRSG